MLISFSVSNFRSIKGTQTVDFSVTEKYHGKAQPHLKNNIFATKNKQVPNLLKSIVLYGSNASGKSNLVKSWHCFGTMILNRKLKRGENIKKYDPFILDKKHQKPTIFAIDFIASNSTRYLYEFAFDSSQIHFEKLSSYKDGVDVSSKLIYEIGFKKNKLYHNFKDSFEGNKDKAIDLFENTQNNLFLSLNINEDGNKFLNPIYDWIENYAEVVFDHEDQYFETLRWIEKDKKNKEKVVKLLQKFDLSVKDIEIEPLEIKLPKHIEEDPDLSEELKKNMRTRRVVTFINPNGTRLKTNKMSLGTLNLFAISAPIFKTLIDGGALFFDEIDKSFHPDILLEIVKMFHDKNINEGNGQALFTAHNDILLDKIYDKKKSSSL
jgi:AAA15 family ATPase/GTPase